MCNTLTENIVGFKVIMQGKLFQRCTHLLYCSVLSYVNYQNPPRILDEHWCIYSCLQIPPWENWFQYIRRVYATAFNFPCIITLLSGIISDIRRAWWIYFAFMIEPPHCSSAKWIITIQGRGFLRASPPTILPVSACWKGLLLKKNIIHKFWNLQHNHVNCFSC